MRHHSWRFGIMLILCLAIPATSLGQERDITPSAKTEALVRGCPPLPHTQSFEAKAIRGPSREVWLGFHPDSREACVGVILEDGATRKVTSATLMLDKNHANIGYIAPILHPQPIYHDEEQLIFAIAKPQLRAAKQTWVFWKLDDSALVKLGEWVMIEESEAGLKAGKVCGPFDRIRQTHIDAKAKRLKISACEAGEYKPTRELDLSTKSPAPTEGSALVLRKEGLGGCPTSTSWREVPIRGGSYKLSLGWNEGAEKACVAVLFDSSKEPRPHAAGVIDAGYLARYDEYTAPSIQDVILANEDRLVFTSVSSWMGRRVEDGGTRVDIWQTSEGSLEHLGSWSPESLSSCKIDRKPWALSGDKKELTLETCRGSKKHRDVIELTR